MGNFWQISGGFWSFLCDFRLVLAIFGDFRLVWEIVGHSQGSIGHVGQFSEDFLAFFSDFKLVWAIFGRS